MLLRRNSPQKSPGRSFDITSRRCARPFLFWIRAVSSANEQMDSGNSLDPIRVKAVFYALCFGDDAPSTRAANSLVEGASTPPKPEHEP